MNTRSWITIRLQRGDEETWNECQDSSQIVQVKQYLKFWIPYFFKEGCTLLLLSSCHKECSSVLKQIKSFTIYGK